MDQSRGSEEHLVCTSVRLSTAKSFMLMRRLHITKYYAWEEQIFRKIIHSYRARRIRLISLRHPMMEKEDHNELTLTVASSQRTTALPFENDNSTMSKHRL